MTKTAELPQVDSEKEQTSQPYVAPSEKETTDAVRKLIQKDGCPVSISAESVKDIWGVTRGYPYFVQYVCREVYDIGVQATDAGQKRRSVPLDEIMRKLDTDFFAGRWAKVTDRQRQLLAVISELANCDSEFTVQEIVEDAANAYSEKPFSSSHIDEMLASLSDAGLIYKDRYGKYSFAVPLLPTSSKGNTSHEQLAWRNIWRHSTLSTVDPFTTAPYNRGGNMSSTRNPGRVAGLWYLLLCIAGPLRLIYIPTKLFVHGDAAATVKNIAAHQWLFRFGIVGDLFGAVVLIFLVMAFYRLFKDVDQYLAMLVVILGGVMPALLYFVNVVSDSGALMIARGADFLAVFDKPQRDALVLLLLRLHDAQNTAAEMLWGLWLLPLGVLVYRSRFLPRFLGVWLVINGIAYVVLCLTGELFPQYNNKAFLMSQPALFGELAFMLWLVIKGSKPQAQNAAAVSPAVA